MVTKKQGRLAARGAAALLVLAAVVQFVAVVHAALGADPPSVMALIVGALIGVLAIAAAAVLLIRVGYWRERAPFQIGQAGAPWVAFAGLGGAVLGFAGQTDVEWYIAGPANLVIALLAIAVMRSELPEPQVSR